MVLLYLLIITLLEMESERVITGSGWWSWGYSTVNSRYGHIIRNMRGYGMSG